MTELEKFRRWVASNPVGAHPLREQISAYHRTFPGRVLLLSEELVAAATSTQEKHGHRQHGERDGEDDG